MKRIKQVVLGALFLGAIFALNIPVSLAVESGMDFLKSSDPTKIIKVERSAAESFTVATVNISEAGFLVKEEGVLSVFFTLSNREGVQPGVKYGVELRSGEDGALIDQVVHQEELSLNENESFKKELTYAPPQYLNGKYKIWAVSENEQGLVLGRALAGEISLSGDEKFIKLDGCSLNVGGEEKKYPLSQLLDVSAEEELSLHCDVKNGIGSDVSVMPNIKTTLRTAFGKIVSEEYGQAIDMRSGTTQKFDLIIPKAQSPQVYELALSLVNGDGEKVANPVVAHYVLRGEGATIQNLKLDKTSYSKGDLASVSLFWSGRADNFLGARRAMNAQEKVAARISILGSDGKACADNFTKELDLAKPWEEMKVNITSDCQNGKMIVSLIGAGEKVLDEKIVEFPKSAEFLEAAKTEKKKNLAFLPYLVAILLFAIGMAAIILKRREKNNTVAPFLFILAAGLLMAINGVQADTWTVTGDTIYLCDNTGIDPPPPCIPIMTFSATFSASLSPASACQDTNLSIDGSASRSVNEGSVSLDYSAGSYSGYLVYDNVDRGGATIPAGNSTGSRSVNFNGTYRYNLPSPWGARSFSGQRSMSFVVNDCTPTTPTTPPSPATVNGACGAAADGRSFASAPTTGLCRLGNLRGNPFLNDAGTRWVWFCDGLNGGTDARCLAPVLNSTCVPDPSDNECFRVSNCAGQNCGEALQTVYCVDECGGSVPIVGGMCGGERCVPERIECECYDGNWKEVQP